MRGRYGGGWRWWRRCSRSGPSPAGEISAGPAASTSWLHAIKQCPWTVFADVSIQQNKKPQDPTNVRSLQILKEFTVSVRPQRSKPHQWLPPPCRGTSTHRPVTWPRFSPLYTIKKKNKSDIFGGSLNRLWCKTQTSEIEQRGDRQQTAKRIG